MSDIKNNSLQNNSNFLSKYFSTPYQEFSYQESPYSLTSSNNLSPPGSVVNNNPEYTNVNMPALENTSYIPLLTLTPGSELTP